MTEAWIRETGGPPVHAADQESEVAEEMVRRLRGRIVARVAARNDEAAARFFRQRQMLLF